MSKLNLYVVRDSLEGKNELILTAKNDLILKRSINGVLLSREENYINTDTKDKDVYHVAVLETDTGVVEGLPAPVFVFNVEQLRIELVQEIRRRREEAGIKEEGDIDGSKKPITKE